jgi:hypothetical protein
MVLLAQLSAADAGSVPRLPDTPIFARYVLENPWPLTVILVAAAIVTMLTLRRQGQDRAASWGLGIGLVLAVVVAGLGMTITTERETLRSRTRELVDLTADARTTELRDLLTERARVGAFMVYFGGVNGREEVLGAVRRYMGEQIPLESHKVGPVQVVVDGPNVARTQVRVWVKPRKDQQMYGVDVGAWFRVDWTRDGTGPWRATTISIMQIDGAGVNGDVGR